MALPRHTLKLLPLLAALSAAWSPAHGQAADASLDTVVVTGSRQAQALHESPTPIDVLQADQLVATGQTNLLDALKDLLPSLNAPAVGYDVGALARSFQLRGLSPGQTLVLVNGKRRHLSASLYADEDPAQGSNSVDLDFIPLAAIDHVEVLRDGAAAQYGSDAIAGVINVILKRGAAGADLAVGGGAYQDGGGGTGQADGSLGWRLGERGFVRLSVDARYHDLSNRSSDSGGPQPARTQGDPRSSLLGAGFNAEDPLADGTLLYAFGTLGARDAKAFENYRSPDFIAGNLTPAIAALYPQGFSPAETSRESDASLTAGAKGKTWGDWAYDLSLGYGRNAVTLGNVNTANASLLDDTGSTPTRFRVGGFSASELTFDLDLRRSVDLGLAAPVFVTWGVQERHETFALVAGDAASNYGTGSIAFPGFAPTDATTVHRDSGAAFVDLSTQLSAAWQLGLAGRVEHYQGSGGTATGKLTTRYVLAPALALRATVSNGFHAPTLVQEHYSATNVNTGGAQIQIPLGSPGAAVLGAPPLKPETSRNLSVGLVAAPARGWNLTLDAYLIDLKNRIVDSGGVSGALAAQAIAANGATVPPDAVDNAYAQFFTNAVDTRTSGVDLHVDTRSELGAAGRIRWNLDAGLNHTGIRSLHDPSAVLQAAGIPVLDPIQVSNLTTATPHLKASLSGDWTRGPWELNLRETYYGRSAQVQWGTDFSTLYTNTVSPAVITDLDVGYDLSDKLRLDLGANNLFNHYPNKTDPLERLNFDQYSHLSPYGINGAYYHVRLSATF